MANSAKSLLIPCGALAAGLVFTFAIFYFWRSGSIARQYGKTTKAAVLKKFTRGGGLENYYASFDFIDSRGIRQSIELKVPSRVWHSLREGETTSITWIPEYPEKSSIGPLWGKKLIGFVLIFMMAVGTGLTLFALAELLRSLGKALN